jgi:hypothetical protein
MRITRLVVWVVIACAVTTCTPKIIPPSHMEPIIVTTQLEVQPLRCTMADLGDFTLTINARNPSADTVDPQLMSARLLVNGVNSEVFGEAISNGIREEAWFSLPPGQTVSLKWTLGYSLFEQPGEYALILDWWGEHEAVTVNVIE